MHCCYQILVIVENSTSTHTLRVVVELMVGVNGQRKRILCLEFYLDAAVANMVFFIVMFHIIIFVQLCSPLQSVWNSVCIELLNFCYAATLLQLVEAM